MSDPNMPEYLNEDPQVESTQIRQQSFTFSKPFHADNPESNQEQHHQNGPKTNHEAQVLPPTQEQEEEEQKEKHKSADKVENQHGNPRKQSISLTPQHRKPQWGDQRSNSDDSQDESKGYKDLTKKLQTALNKISSSTSKQLNKTSSQTNTVWRRFEECADRKKKDIELKKKQTDLQKSRHYQQKPTINKHSEKIAKETGYKPIYARFQKLLEEKKKKEEEIEENKRKEKQMEEAMFMEELNRHMRKPENKRTYDRYFHEMVTWKEKKQQVNRQKFQAQKSKELEGATFKPLLNSKSQKMVASQCRLPIEQRGLVKKNVKPEYTFAPNLTKKR